MNTTLFKSALSRRIIMRTYHKGKVVFAARLGDLGLGRSNGIGTDLTTESAIKAYGLRLASVLVSIKDKKHLSCIDGRCVLKSYDNLPPEVRSRQVGGSAVAFETALYSGSKLVKVDETSESPLEYLTRLIKYLREYHDIYPSTHEGGCGGVNGLPDDARVIATDGPVWGAVKSFMSLPEVRDATGVDFDEDSKNKIIERANQAALWLERKGWCGDDYVKSAKKQDPNGDEILRTDHDEFHGHHERAVAVIISRDRTISQSRLTSLGLGEVFVMNLQASISLARIFSSSGSETTYRECLMANLAKHFAVAHRLPCDRTPFYVIKG